MTQRPTNPHIYIDEVMTDYAHGRIPMPAYDCLLITVYALPLFHCYNLTRCIRTDSSRRTWISRVKRPRRVVYVFERTISLGVSYACCVHARHLDLTVSPARRITSAHPVETSGIR